MDRKSMQCKCGLSMRVRFQHSLAVEVLAATLARILVSSRAIRRRRERRVANMERQQSILVGHAVTTKVKLARIESQLVRASNDAAHIEFLSHQYAFVTFLPSISGVLLAIAVITLSNLEPIQLLLVCAALILSVLSPLFMLLLGRQYRREAPDRWAAVQQRGGDRAQQQNEVEEVG